MKFTLFTCTILQILHFVLKATLLSPCMAKPECLRDSVAIERVVEVNECHMGCEKFHGNTKWGVMI